MSTWAGALVQTKGHGDLAAVAAKHRITLEGDVTPWVLVQGDVDLASLCPPVFAEALSRELHGTVIAFFVQSTASVEQIEHWEDGELLRKLEYSGDEGGWITQQGEAQAWEPSYFFAEGEGTAEGAKWPLNLGDEITDDERARYERARAAKDASSVMDLLSGGSTRAIHRLCAHFGVDPKKPGAHARCAPRTNWRPRIIAAAIGVFLVGAFLLGALTRR